MEIGEVKYKYIVFLLFLFTHTSSHMDLTVCCLFTSGSYITSTYFLSAPSLRLPIAGVFSRRPSTSVCITVLSSTVVVMETGQKAVPRQERLCPEPAHAVLTAGEQNVAHCTSGQRDVGKTSLRLKSAGSSSVMFISHLVLIVRPKSNPMSGELK